ncbi:uncharacterized protein STEHIDRAFT_120190 [Stereum hirsutum FP-91666 SS1]|uniref:uncharacterized protein n=1 Tax=Stereum hirsutum (strain FP-91666) TaxID=721885 RepID=UPI000440CC26|nr:uncharacterized protein STEHIDRAFT_120190 [Stereum hirsutum FP-91666 SS1]EIM87955.1 hypothetical protein STEHIDRAFT_120190 [Stereum hirsutum FP-91666 SS1]
MPVDYTHTVIARTTSSWLLHEARTFISQGIPSTLRTSAYDNSGIWYEMYTSLIERIKRHITESKLAATKFELIYKDQSASISLKTDAVMGLTALTEIHVALYNALNHEESRRLAVNAAIEIISISDGLPKDRYDLLDHLFLVCWKTVREVLQQEQARLLGANADDTSTQTAVYAGTIPSLLTALRECIRRLRAVAPFGQRPQ